MPRRNLYWLLAISVVSLLCFQKVQSTRYGRIIGNAMQRVERKYLHKVEAEELFKGAMEGMIARLGDPYSAYLEPEEAGQLNETLDQSFVGVGMHVLVDPQSKQLLVAFPLPGSPAARKGLRAGDRIVRIGERNTEGMSLKEAVRLLRGKPGDAVTLTIQREGLEKPLVVEIVRELIHTPSIEGDRRSADGTWDFFLEGQDRIGYVRITTFGRDTCDELLQALNWLAVRNMRGLILDLRDNPGGLLQAARDVCDLFVPEGVIVTTRGRNGQVLREYRASGKAVWTDFPMAVLVNRHSASASEIVAACLQDHRRAVVVGERTLGKGTVQEVIDLEAGLGAMRLTTASYWRPSEVDIHRYKEAPESENWGVRPDEGFVVPVDKELAIRLDRQRMRRQGIKLPPAEGDPAAQDEQPVVDPQLAKAVEAIERLLSRPARAEKPERS